VFQLCGQRPVTGIAAELAAKLKLGVETMPPEKQTAAVKAWLAERRIRRPCDHTRHHSVVDLVEET
jgi:hypothetical protein